MTRAVEQAVREPHLTNVDPYAELPRLYDAEYDALEADGAFFSREAAQGPLLIVGCGTGRICRLMEANRSTTGLDRSAPMLQEARARAAALSHGAASSDRPRIAPGGTLYHRADMCDFAVGSFGEVIAPNAAFAFLESQLQRTQCLLAIHAALTPGGSLWIDVPMANYERWEIRHSPEATAWEGEVDGRDVRRTRETFRMPEQRLLQLVDRYYVGEERIAESELRLHIASPEELELTVESCGFYVDTIRGGYSNQPVGPGTPRILLRAVRA